MKDNILNQEEIKRLIDQLNHQGSEIVKKITKEEQEQKDAYQKYDFNRPDKFTSENIRSLETIANAFARGVSLDLTNKCRYTVTLKMSKGEGASPIEQIPYGSEYQKSVGNDRWVFAIINLRKDGRHGSVVLQMDMSFTRAIHENQLGDGEGMDWIDDFGPFSEIDQIVITDWIEKTVFPSLKTSFQNVELFDLSLREKIETDPQYVKITMDTDVVAVIPFDVEFGPIEKGNARSSVVQLVIPYSAVESIADRLTTDNAIEHQLMIGNAGEEEIIKKHLESVSQRIDIELGKSTITIRQLLNLEEEGVLELNQHYKRDIKGYIGNIHKFNCKPGRKGERYAVRLTGFAKRREMKDDE